jgi:hypothetical protein
LSRCAGAFRADALGRRWLIGIILDACIAAAAETGLTLFKAVEPAIEDFVAQIHHRTPRIILGLGGRDRDDRRSDEAERKKRKLHFFPRVDDCG